MVYQNFGEHFTLDGYGGDYSRLNNELLVREVLSDLPGILDMHPLAEYQIVQAPDNGMNDPGGWSGVVMIAESHISIHTFPKRGFVSTDVYTCKNNLDVRLITEYFIKKFALKDVETNLLMRGTKYPTQNLYAEEGVT